MRLYRQLHKDLLLAGMEETPKSYLKKSLVPATIFSISATLLTFFALQAIDQAIYTLLAAPLWFALSMYAMIRLPAANANIIRKKIESDLFWPSRMLVTLIEAGKTLPSAFRQVSKTKTLSGNYFAKLAAEIRLGKSMQDAVEDAIRYTPSKSFKRVLEPIKNSLRTGADVEQNLLETLDDLTDEKILEIERYEKRLAPVSMFYLLFGAIIPTFLAIGAIVLLSVAGITVSFFPFMFVLLVFVLLVQVLFYQLFKSIRPLVQL